VRVIFHTENNPNFIVPLEMTWKIFQKNNETMWIAKQDYEKDWGQFSIKISVEDYDKDKH